MWTFLFIVIIWIFVTFWAFMAGKTWLVLSSLGLLLLCIYDLKNHESVDDNNEQKRINASEAESQDVYDSYSPNKRPSIVYSEEDDSYDGFYKQREEEYRQEYGDDFEDAIDDAWEERKKR